MISNVLVSGVLQSESVVHTHISIFLKFFPHIGHYRVLNRIPWSLLSILYTVVCVYYKPHLPIYPFLTYPLVTISLFSKSVTLLLFCQLSSFIPFCVCVCVCVCHWGTVSYWQGTGVFTEHIACGINFLK